MRRRAAIGLLLLVLLAGAAGCGGGGGGGGAANAPAAASSFKSLAAQLSDWFNGIRPLADDIDQVNPNVTRFRVRDLPPPIPVLRRISSPGLAAGRDAKASATQIYSYTDLTTREVKGLYCYFFSWYVQHGVIPTEPRSFEEAMFGYLQGRLFPSTPVESLRSTVNLFRESIVNAQSAGEASARVAVATACSWPSR